jgi:GH15 family glucan-1,4-alpha-glucosidase
MTRHIVLGNQSLLVNIDKWLQIRDIYFPHVGQENHLLGRAQRIGVYADGRLSWINEDGWIRKIAYKDDTLATDNRAENKGMGVELNLEENIHCNANILLRKITVKNNRDFEREIKLFFNNPLNLYGDGIGDTAVYQKDRNVVIHYKRSRYFLTGVLKSAVPQKIQSDIDDYAVGQAEEGKAEGTFKDAEDGFLSKNPIAQGSVDSTIGVYLKIPGKSKTTVYYYLTAGEDFKQVYELHDLVFIEGPEGMLTHAEECQRSWVGQTTIEMSGISPRLASLLKRSLLVIKTQIDKGGAIIAANDSDNTEFNKDTYSYMWPRDGALVAITLIKAGFPEMVKPFFEFCSRALYLEGCFLHKYNPDGTLGSSWHPWVYEDRVSLPIQEDGTALVLHALWAYYERTKDIEFIKKMYEPSIKLMGEFLLRYIQDNGLPMESYDLWEERRAIFTFTTSAVLAGLTAAGNMGQLFMDAKFTDNCNRTFKLVKKAMEEYLYKGDKGYFRRSVSFERGTVVYDDAMDSSAYGVFEFNVFGADDPKVVSTMNRMKEWLWVKTGVGGMSRYLDDKYRQNSQDLDQVPGNPWIICSLWYAKWLIKKAKTIKELNEALDVINWTADHALTTGILPEQIHPYTGEPLSVSPLTWSHAEFVDTAMNYLEKKRELNKKQ